ncbi:nucleoside monophosphate kinase [bacterium]|nr:nucleoside monophosphate kinase [bacterium]
MMIIVIAGPPGGGKDTQAARMAERLQAYIISPGALLRAEATVDQDLAAQLKRGDLADDDHVNELVGEAMLAHRDQTLILDGTPRHVPQVAWLRDFLEKHFKGIQTVLVELRVSDQELRIRATKRGRADDSPASFEHRLDIYHQEIVPAIHELARYMPHIVVNGEQSIDTIAQEIAEAMKERGYL